jgi:hypothetical protein
MGSTRVLGEHNNQTSKPNQTNPRIGRRRRRRRTVGAGRWQPGVLMEVMMSTKPQSVATPTVHTTLETRRRKPRNVAEAVWTARRAP